VIYSVRLMRMLSVAYNSHICCFLR